MPVRIIRRGATPEAPSAPAVPSTPAKEVIEAAPTIPEVEVVYSLRGWVVADCTILHKTDLDTEIGRYKFLVHRVKTVWYLIRGHDPDERKVALTAQSTLELNARIDYTLEKNYVVVVTPEGTVKPPEEVMSFVHKKLPALVHSSAQEKEDDPAKSDVDEAGEQHGPDREG